MFYINYARCIILLFTSFSHIAFCEADSSLSASCASYPSPAGWQRSRVVQHYLCSSCPDCSDSADCSYSGCSYFYRSCSCLYSDLCSDPYSACLCSCPCFYSWPVFSHLGEQSVLNQELCAIGTPNDTAVFGFCYECLFSPRSACVKSSFGT